MSGRAGVEGFKHRREVAINKLRPMPRVATTECPCRVCGESIHVGASMLLRESVGDASHVPCGFWRVGEDGFAKQIETEARDEAARAAYLGRGGFDVHEVRRREQRKKALGWK